MPRKPKSPWPVIKRTLELAVLHGRNNLTVIQASLDIDLQKLRKEEGEAIGDTPDTRTIRWIVNDYINGLSPEAVMDLLRPSVWALREDHETLKQLAEVHKAESQEKPYQEPSHKDKMRELAAKLEYEIRLPRISDCFLDQLRPGGRFLGEDMLPIRISQKGKVQVELRIEETDTPNAHLYQALCAHLKTSSYSEVLSDIGDWKRALAKHLEECHRLLLAVREEIHTVSIPSGNGEQPGATEWFPLLICGDAVMQATGSLWITDSWYRHEGLNLRCGSYGIYIGISDEDLKARADTHKRLRTKYAGDRQVKLIAKQREGLMETIKGVTSMLQKFRDMERLPGKCELCS